LPVKINILWLIDHAGCSPVKWSIDLQLFMNYPDSQYMAKIYAAANKRVYTVPRRTKCVNWGNAFQVPEIWNLLFRKVFFFFCKL